MQGDNHVEKTGTTAGETATGSATHLISAREGSQDTIDGDADSKGKRFHSWLSTDGSHTASGIHLTGDKGMYVFREWIE